MIPHWQAQSCISNHNTREILPELTPQHSKNSNEVGPTTTLVLVQTGPTPLDKNPSMGYGVPINNIAFTTPTVTLWSDTCEYGIRGYNNKGMAWRWYIPHKWYAVLTLNLLAFLASAVPI